MWSDADMAETYNVQVIISSTGALKRSIFLERDLRNWAGLKGGRRSF